MFAPEFLVFNPDIKGAARYRDRGGPVRELPEKLE
jgi:hypothetical protein